MITEESLATMFKEEKLLDESAFAMEQLYKQAEKAAQEERIAKFERMYQAIKFVHEYCNVHNLRLDAPRAVEPLIQTASDFPSLYILPVHLARTLNTLNGGSKDEILASCEQLRAEISKLKQATNNRIEEVRRQEISLTAMTQEERDTRDRAERLKLHLFDQTVIPPKRSVSNYTFSPINENIPAFDPVFGIEEGLTLSHFLLTFQITKKSTNI
jgi:hypothetical protein